MSLRRGGGTAVSYPNTLITQHLNNNRLWGRTLLGLLSTLWVLPIGKIWAQTEGDIWGGSFVSVIHVPLCNMITPLDTISVMRICLFYLFLFSSLLVPVCKTSALCCTREVENEIVLLTSPTSRIAVTLLFQFIFVITNKKNKCCSSNK